MPLFLRPTLRQVFALSLLGLLLSLALLFYLIFKGSEQTILRSADRLRKLESLKVVNRTTAYLDEAPAAVALFEKQVKRGLVDPKKTGSIQSNLLSMLLANESISEASFTYGDSHGFGEDGQMKIDRATAGQVTVFRAGSGLLSRCTWFDGKQFVSSTTDFTSEEKPVPAMDPTDHYTFTTPSDKNSYGELLWTDLHWSQLDEGLPENQRHVEMGVLKSIEDSHAQFAGVLRMGLMKEQIDNSVKPDAASADENDPSMVFLCDNQGRLITGFGKDDHVTEFGEDLRMTGAHVPPPVTAALKESALKSIRNNQTVAVSFQSAGEIYFCTFRAFPKGETQDWIVGVVVPRSYYLGELEQIQQRVLWASLALIAAIIMVGGLVLHSIGRAHSLIVRETSRMNAFEFSRSENSSRLRDVGDVLSGLERAKTAMRAMGKYVPVDLVRRLYSGGREPMLGGESVDLSVLFTDVKGFTSFAEQNEPDKVAEILGRYLQAMAAAIQDEKGTIDKYIGDAVMAFWNAPEEVPNHALLACAAALRCRSALRALYDSPEWQGVPAFETRFGLHRCDAYVGHFGAPDRFNYTAIGDGINLASRLEGLNKHYGTAIIASESVHAAACEQFEFRLLDRVAVKGKTQGITIYELVGTKTADKARPPVFENYEKAFAEFQRANFKAALALLETESHDQPGMALAARCREYIERPPAVAWDGIRIFESK